MTGRLRLDPLTPDGLPRFQELLGGEEFGGCFCAVWTHFDDTWGERCADPSRPNLACTEQDVLAGRRPGFFVLDGDRLLGWTGCGPRTEFPILDRWPGSRLRAAGPGVWSIGCVALRAETRGRGYAESVVQAIVEKARGEGASRLEAYPSRPWTEARAYRGALSMYERLGFREVGAESAGDSEIVLLERRFDP